MIGNCKTIFLSGDGEAHVVGATANLLLVVNEAQDIQTAVYEKNFAPMAASRNATRVFCGTTWTSSTLLAKMTRACQEAEKRDGVRRVFFYNAEEVRKENQWYGDFVDGQVKLLGRNHPFVKTQFFCEEIDAQAGMFPPGRQTLMSGSHPAQTEPQPGKTYAFLIDVAGQDESSTGGMYESRAIRASGAIHESPLQNRGRDSTFLKIVEIDRSTVEMLGKPTYKVVLRQAWTGQKHVTVFGALRALGQAWQPRSMLIDATGVGEGLWSLLEHAFGEHVVSPVKFTPSLKSELGYGFLAIIESGRYQEYHPLDPVFRLQMDNCRSEILPGPGQLMRWGVPGGTRDSASGETVHDDDLITGAMCSLLDHEDWHLSLPGVIIPGRDPLEEMSRIR